MRLFTAIAIPEPVREKLIAMQPLPVTGLRPVAVDQLHLTLHFLGDADLETISAALKPIHAQPFPVTLRCAGFFRGRDGAATLWAGVEPAEALSELHAALTKLLVSAGFKPESRPYSPHVTLARCSAAVPQQIVSGFISANVQAEPGTWMVSGVGLWSSSSMGGGPPVYRQERNFPLIQRYAACAH